MNSISKNYTLNGFREPYTVSEQLKPEIDRLQLGGAVSQIRDEGYTIVENAISPDLCSRVRNAVLHLAAEEKGNYFDLKKGQGYSAYHLFGKDPSFTEVLLNPQLLALTEFLCGGDFLLSQLSGSVRFEGAEAMTLHMDALWYPPTDYNPMFTACLALDDLTLDAGTTKVVPGSHKLMETPSDAQSKTANTIPIECSVGALAFWNGYTWHSNYPRKLPGERVMLHLTFCRAPYRPVEDYSNIGHDYLKDYPEVIATMLGRNSYFGNPNRNGGACDMEYYEQMFNAVRR